ncbi:MAG: DNA cytosine methyltransferase [Labedaea sp.]
MTNETIGSLCSGAGGLDRATLLRPAWHAEIEPAPAALLAKRHPGVPNLGDFRVTDWSAVEPVTEMVMGVPCQPFSAAGRQRAEADGRYLWPSAYAGIVALRPRRIFFENVRNLVSIKGGTVWRGILDDLREAGYLCRWLILGACAVGAPHHRHRVFLMAWHVGPGAPPAERIEVQTCGSSHPVLPTVVARDAMTRGEDGPEFWEAKRATGWTGGMPLGAELALLPTPQARDGLGGDQPSTVGGCRDSGAKRAISLSGATSLLPSPRASDGTNGGPNQGIASGDIALPSAVQPERFGKYAAAVARWEAVTGHPAPEPTELGPRGGRRLAAPFAEWMMGYAPGYLTDHLDRRAALKAAGNGVVTLQAAHARHLLLQK